MLKSWVQIHGGWGPGEGTPPPPHDLESPGECPPPLKVWNTLGINTDLIFGSLISFVFVFMSCFSCQNIIQTSLIGYPLKYIGNAEQFLTQEEKLWQLANPYPPLPYKPPSEFPRVGKEDSVGPSTFEKQFTPMVEIKYMPCNSNKPESVPVPKQYFLTYIVKGTQFRSPLHQHSVKTIHEVMK